MPPAIYGPDQPARDSRFSNIAETFYDAVDQPRASSSSGSSESHSTSASSNSVSERPNPAVQSRATSSSRFASEEASLDREDEGDAGFTTRGGTRAVPMVSFEASGLMCPRSRYNLTFNETTGTFEAWTPPLPLHTERSAVEVLLEAYEKAQALSSTHKASAYDDFIEFELNEFSIYLPGSNVHHSFEFRSLSQLATEVGNSSFLFDGVLSVGDERRYVQGVPFLICSIGNYEPEHASVDGHIWIQSTHNTRSNIYYRLKAPALEYARFHSSFLWLADFAKHFVDFCRSRRTDPKRVSIHDFRTNFSKWIWKMHKSASKFRAWYAQHSGNDFRRAVNQNVTFLFKEAIGVDARLRRESIWAEVLDKTFIEQHPIKEENTVVTPYVYECFSHMKFGEHLRKVVPTVEAEVRHNLQGQALHLAVDKELLSDQYGTAQDSKTNHRDPHDVRNEAEKHLARSKMIQSIKPGSVISVAIDGNGSVWKDEVSRWKAADECWYLLVQAVHTSGKGLRTFDGIWLYRASDTICAKMKYPFPNELFLSDHCTCQHSREEEERILGIVTVDWNSSPATTADFFIRQTYIEGEQFVTLQQEHKTCKHLTPEIGHQSKLATKGFKPGTTILVEMKRVPQRQSKHLLEPYEVVKMVTRGQKVFVGVRRLLRRAELIGSSCAPNELVYTNIIDQVPASAIVAGCLVRFYSQRDVERDLVPVPYCRGGTGNAFYITSRLLGQDTSKVLEPIHAKIPSSLIEGFDPEAPLQRERLSGLDMFCGGGNFGRGLEEGGAVHQKWAIDLAPPAIHSYYANLKDPTSIELYSGSVDDFLLGALHGHKARPLPGDVDFISAGSPCQGFSLLNHNKNNHQGLKNQSLVASVAAYIDFYRPKYGVLENVMNMAKKRKGRDEDVLSQLLCAIVGMGYQVQVFVVDSWSCGSPQTRSRIFVSFTAPGYEPMQHPALSHSHPDHIRDVGVGLKANGESFGHRKFGPTAFEFISARQATEDLPNIGDARTLHCILQPDHTISHLYKVQEQARIACIPKYPRGMNFLKTWMDPRGIITKAERDLFPLLGRKGKLRASVSTGSRAWGRVHPDALFSTIVVRISAEDARMGTCLHWDQNRYISILEARRAQSFPDDEVIIGTRMEQWKIVGNSVARTVALAFGLALREAWLKNPAVNQIPSFTQKRGLLGHKQAFRRPRLNRSSPFTTASLDELASVANVSPNPFDESHPLPVDPVGSSDDSDHFNTNSQRYRRLAVSNPSSLGEVVPSTSASSVDSSSTGNKRPSSTLTTEAINVPPNKAIKLMGQNGVERSPPMIFSPAKQPFMKASRRLFDAAVVSKKLEIVRHNASNGSVSDTDESSEDEFDESMIQISPQPRILQKPAAKISTAQVLGRQAPQTLMRPKKLTIVRLLPESEDDDDEMSGARFTEANRTSP
ncbi:hypothetical protein BP5796_07202 [Coleophoma crateriformis]|uniref:DNA (cytosine-5-)-methyltransferase n=1 Tax=Coleophoma crateriformis TaxID=565419 RepID=A0A3D8RIF9_9HELO|nr:hypothetical protein BP5796_07202 [Coleophoma crateriformis]